MRLQRKRDSFDGTSRTSPDVVRASVARQCAQRATSGTLHRGRRDVRLHARDDGLQRAGRDSLAAVGLLSGAETINQRVEGVGRVAALLLNSCVAGMRCHRGHKHSDAIRRADCLGGGKVNGKGTGGEAGWGLGGGGVGGAGGMSNRSKA